MNSLPKARLGGKPVFSKNETFLQGGSAFVRATERATASDGVFFRTHRSREFRARLALPDEFPIIPRLVGDAIFIAVRRLGPMLRARIAFVAPASSPVDSFTDAEAEAVWDHVVVGDGIIVIDDMSRVVAEKEALQ